MKAQEVRVGNYVYDTKGQVNIIDLEALTYIIKEPNNQVKPIPLTEEWLVKLGFTKQYDENVYDIGNSRIEKIIWGDDEPEWKFRRLLGNDLSHWKHSMKAVEFVHQLQNAVHALTGEELKTTKP